MKNRDLIAMLSALPLDIDVLVHVDDDNDNDIMAEPQEAHTETTCNDDEMVIRLNCWNVAGSLR